jgi:hypothetical protein
MQVIIVDHAEIYTASFLTSFTLIKVILRGCARRSAITAILVDYSSDLDFTNSTIDFRHSVPRTFLLDRFYKDGVLRIFILESEYRTRCL